MLKIEALREHLNTNIDAKRKSRFEVAFRSLGYQDEYCRYHYEQYHKEYKLFRSAMTGDLDGEGIQNPQYYRIAFEANCFAFFCALHSLIESIIALALFVCFKGGCNLLHQVTVLQNG